MPSDRKNTSEQRHNSLSLEEAKLILRTAAATRTLHRHETADTHNRRANIKLSVRDERH
jgi:hypothetical protein